MRIIYWPERNDLVIVTLSGSNVIVAKIMNVDGDGAIYCIKTDGTKDFICNKYKWDVIEKAWIISGKDITL